MDETATSTITTEVVAQNPALMAFRENMQKMPAARLPELVHHDIANITPELNYNYLRGRYGLENQSTEIRDREVEGIKKAETVCRNLELQGAEGLRQQEYVTAREHLTTLLIRSLERELVMAANMGSNIYANGLEIIEKAQIEGGDEIERVAKCCRRVAAYIRLVPTLVESAQFLLDPTDSGLDRLKETKVMLRDVAYLVDSTIECPNIEVSGTDAVILLNLMNNASKFNGGKAPDIVVKDGTIEVTNYYDTPLLNRAFEMGVTEDTGRGHGFGLAIAKLYADLTGKKIRVRNVVKNNVDEENSDSKIIQITTSLRAV